SESVAGNNPSNEWESVISSEGELGSNVGISGWVCSTNPKGPDEPKDMPFTHPFYNDWTFYLAPDPRFKSLLSCGDIAVHDDDGRHDKGAWSAREYAEKRG